MGNRKTQIIYGNEAGNTGAEITYGNEAEMADENEITIIEDTREDLQDFLGMAQEIERMDEEEKKERIEEIFGEQEESDEEEQEELSESAQARQDEIKGRQGSRANVDVALAMQIADQVAAEAAAEPPCYVVHGAKVLCSMGSREARLVTPMDHGVLLENTPQLVAGDSAALTNIMCFGNCFSVDNPNMAQAAVDATNQYNQRKAQGFWGRLKAKFGIKPKVVTQVSKELQQLCICECEPSFTKGALWEEGYEKCKIKGQETLLQPATLVCAHGGVIRIVDNGQKEQNGQNE